MPDDILDFNDRVVHEDARYQRDSEQSHHVQRKAQRLHRPESGEDRERQGDRGDDRRAKIPEK